jgi:hypothetical protein
MSDIKEKKQIAIVEVTTDELVKALMAVKGPTPATFIAETVLDMRKTDNPYYKKVLKRQKSNVFINFNYENSVNKALTKEGKEADFEAQPRKWGVRVPGTPLVLHEGAYYLTARFLSNEPKVELIHEGKEIDRDVLSQFIPEKKSSGNQGLENEIIVRDFSINNIKEIQFGGTKYIVKNKK